MSKSKKFFAVILGFQLLYPMRATAQEVRDGHADFALGAVSAKASGDLETETLGGIATEISGLQYPVGGGFAAGFYLRNVIVDGDVENSGFGFVEDDESVGLDTSTFGVMLGWRFSSETEIVLGLGTMRLDAEQDDTKRSLGANDYMLRLSQGFMKYGVVSVSASQTAPIDESYAGDKQDMTFASTVIAVGFRMRQEDWRQ